MQSALQRYEMAEEAVLESPKSNGKGQRINTVLVALLFLCGFCITATLAVWGCTYSYYPQRDYSQESLFMADSTVIHVLLFLSLCAIAWLLDWVLRNKCKPSLQENISLGVLMFATLWVLTVGVLIVTTVPYYPEGDQLNVTAGAYYNLQGNFSMLQPGGYVGLYQQQKGFMFLYEILFSIFGNFCYDKAQLFHVFFAILILEAGYGFIKNLTERVSYRILFCMVMMGCAPMFIYLPYIYGDIPSICFSMVLFWALSAYVQKLQKRYVVIAALAASLALLCRMNTWIVLIAVAIGMVLLALQKWSYKPLVAGLCILLAAGGAVKAVDVMYEYRSGYESGIGIPSILWIAMGLQETDGEPGVYNRYQQSVFEENHFDREASAQVGKEYITQRLEEFGDNPSMAVDFFQRKLQSQWLEPYFESLDATVSFDKDRYVEKWVGDLYFGELHDAIWRLSNYYQSVVFLAVAFCVAGAMWRIGELNDSSVKWIPLIAIVGGFLFSMIWENQCRYCLPYYIYMLLFVPEGILQLGDWVADFVKFVKSRSQKKDNGDGKGNGLKAVS